MVLLRIYSNERQNGKSQRSKHANQGWFGEAVSTAVLKLCEGAVHLFRDSAYCSPSGGSESTGGGKSKVLEGTVWLQIDRASIVYPERQKCEKQNYWKVHKVLPFGNGAYLGMANCIGKCTVEEKEKEKCQRKEKKQMRDCKSIGIPSIAPAPIVHLSTLERYSAHHNQSPPTLYFTNYHCLALCTL